jgi:hypothetical protein
VKRIILALLLPLAAPAAAQELRPLTEEAATAVAEFYNHPATTRLRGESRIAAGTTVDGRLASLGGPLVVAGTVRGDVVVINGDLVILGEGSIAGSVRVVGGRLEGPHEAIANGAVIYREPMRFRREGDRIVAPGVERPAWPSAGRATIFGRTDFSVDMDGSYNRVEGLPIRFGPRIQLGHSNPTVVDARLIYRTRTGLRVHHREFGHDLQVQQYMGGHRGMLLGVGLHRLVNPIEDRGLSDTENSLATFILHQDFRDHYERHGWSAYLRLVGPTRPYEVGIEYRDETHRSIDPGSPWSLIRNDSPWRPQPAVAEGDLRSVIGSFRWDSRNDPVDPAAGWLVSATVEQGVGGTLGHADPVPADARFTAVSVDARRYLRLGPRSRLALRARAAGAPDRGALPAQRQHVLGGEGQLPGFPGFTFDCGARAEEPGQDGLYPYYGCDRVVLLQAEYRFALLHDAGLARRLGLDFDLFANPELVLFADAGRAWIEARALDARLDTGPRVLHPDVGAGLRMGPVGLYLAVPLSNAAAGPNLFVRLGPRL